MLSVTKEYPAWIGFPSELVSFAVPISTFIIEFTKSSVCDVSLVKVISAIKPMIATKMYGKNKLAINFPDKFFSYSGDFLMKYHDPSTTKILRPVNRKAMLTAPTNTPANNGETNAKIPTRLLLVIIAPSPPNTKPKNP